MKKIIIISILILSITNCLLAQTKESSFYLDGGFGLNLLYPKEVNDFISSDLSSKNYFIQSGTSDIILGFTAHAGLIYKMPINITIEGLGVFSVAPKFITVDNGTSETYMIYRMGAGGILGYNFPVSKLVHIRPGVGLLGNVVGFEDESSASLGKRGQVSFIFKNNELIDFNITIGIDLAKSETPNIPKEINMSSVFLSSCINLKLN